MKNRRRLITVTLAASVLSTLLTPLDCQAGRFCDWLFRRNQSQNLAGVANPAVDPAVPRIEVTAGYPPTATCGAAFCQQTVVRYVPQIAYRTAYQPVPVTTYRTSTNINPANGLPMTCTRPCTSYTYQAQRVPYTTYRPVYTTVPVTLPPTGGVQPAPAQGLTAVPPTTPTTTLYPPSPPYGYQPPTGVGCIGCQGGATSAPHAGTTPPGYSPAPLGITSPAPDPPGATPWTQVSPNSFDSPPLTGDPVGATPWQTVPGGAASPGSQDVMPADRDPSLRPAIPDSLQRSLRPVPRPESFRRDRGNGSDNQRSDGYGRRPELQGTTNSELQGPMNQNLHETRRPTFDSRAVRDLDRERREANSDFPGSNSDDKTARRSAPPSVPSKPTRIATQPPQATEYTAVPIRWAVDQLQTERDNRKDPTSPDWQWRHENESTGAGWFPIR